MSPERVAAGAWVLVGRPIAGQLPHADATPPVAISRRSQPATSSPHEQPIVAPPFAERYDTNAGHSEQCVRLTGAASIGHGSPTQRWRTKTPHGARGP